MSDRSFAAFQGRCYRIGSDGLWADVGPTVTVVPVVSLLDDSQEQLSDALQALHGRLDKMLREAQSWEVPSDHHYDTYVEDLQAFLEQGALALSVFLIEDIGAVTEQVKKLEEQFTVLEGIASRVSRPLKRLRRTPSGPEENPEVATVTNSMAATQIDNTCVDTLMDTLIGQHDEDSLRRQGARFFEENSQSRC
jgi:hypothetical protein